MESFFARTFRNGSSPHTWGIQAWPILRSRLLRFIPTYVGHTDSINRVPVRPAVHPHIRGAYYDPLPQYSSICGSSPHTWGIRSGCHSWDQVPRFIPTYVGHTFFSSPTTYPASVHPHIRGAYQDPVELPQSVIGSSPHTWGILLSGLEMMEASRFIPTYVGHTSSNKAPMMPVSVHPHIRGAYFPADARKGRFGGSSPHTWGILPYIVFGIGNDRFIPTYVGHTYSQN